MAEHALVRTETDYSKGTAGQVRAFCSCGFWIPAQNEGQAFLGLSRHVLSEERAAAALFVA